MDKMHHPRADVDRLYLLRARSGRGLTNVELSYKTIYHYQFSSIP